MCLLLLVALYWPGPLTVSSRRLDSILSSSAQMAPCASQSVVAGRVIVTSPLESGLTTISHRRFLPLTSRRAPVPGLLPAVAAVGQGYLVQPRVKGEASQGAFPDELPSALRDGAHKPGVPGAAGNADPVGMNEKVIAALELRFACARPGVQLSPSCSLLSWLLISRFRLVPGLLLPGQGL